MKETRTKSIGAKYNLTPELKAQIRFMRKEINYTAEQMAKSIDLNLNTYNNIEKVNGSTSIKTQTLNKFFEIYKQEIGLDYITLDEFMVLILEKYLYSPNSNIEKIQEQDWLKAYYLKHQYVYLTDALERQLLRQFNSTTPDVECWKDLISSLNRNRHIKLKTKIIYDNEVYINLDKTTYPDLGGYPFWCIKFNLTEKEIEEIARKIIKTKQVKYSMLFSLLVSEELEERIKKDYDQIYYDVYCDLKDYGYNNIFDMINNVKNDFVKKSYTGNFGGGKAPTDKNNFFDKVKELENGNLPRYITQFIENCVGGKDNFLKSIDIDFSPLFNASASDIDSFRATIKELLNNVSARSEKNV